MKRPSEIEAERITESKMRPCPPRETVAERLADIARRSARNNDPMRAQDGGDLVRLNAVDIPYLIKLARKKAGRHNRQRDR